MTGSVKGLEWIRRGGGAWASLGRGEKWDRWNRRSKDLPGVLARHHGGEGGTGGWKAWRELGRG